MEEKLKANKFKILGGVLGIFVLAGAVLGTYRFSQREVQLVPQPTPQPEAGRPLDETANWKTYTNTKYGYSIKYPEDWEINRGPGNLNDTELSRQREIDFYSLEASPPGASLIINTNELHPAGEQVDCPTLKNCVDRVSEGFPSSDMRGTTFLGEPALLIIYDRITESHTQTNHHFFFMKDGDFYHLHYYLPKEEYGRYKEVLDLMLSTLKFL